MTITLLYDLFRVCKWDRTIPPLAEQLQTLGYIYDFKTCWQFLATAGGHVDRRQTCLSKNAAFLKQSPKAEDIVSKEILQSNTSGYDILSNSDQVYLQLEYAARAIREMTGRKRIHWQKELKL